MHGGVLTMLNKHFAFVEFRSDSRYIHRSFTQGVFFMTSVSKIFVRFMHINAFNVDELKRWCTMQAAIIQSKRKSAQLSYENCQHLILNLYNKFWESGHIRWKTSIVIPIPKQKIQTDPTSYRPISFTSIFPETWK
jgi:hypothetical protein